MEFPRVKKKKTYQDHLNYDITLVLTHQHQCSRFQIAGYITCIPHLCLFFSFEREFFKGAFFVSKNDTKIGAFKLHKYFHK